MDVRHLVAADPAWRAVFDDDSIVRIVAWAAVGDDAGIVGLVVDPREPGRVVPAPEAVTPDGFAFARYGFRPDAGAAL